MTVYKGSHTSNSPALGPTVFDVSVCEVSVTYGDRAFLSGPLAKALQLLFDTFSFSFSFSVSWYFTGFSFLLVTYLSFSLPLTLFYFWYLELAHLPFLRFIFSAYTISCVLFLRISFVL